MVKFGKQLVESRVVEWETYYIDYKTLKKLLKRGDEGHGVPGAACDAFEAAVLAHAARAEAFYDERVLECSSKLSALQQPSLASSSAASSAAAAAAAATAVAAVAATAATARERANELRALHCELALLLDFCALNYLAVVKIIAGGIGGGCVLQVQVLRALAEDCSIARGGGARQLIEEVEAV